MFQFLLNFTEAWLRKCKRCISLQNEELITMPNSAYIKSQNYPVQPINILQKKFQNILATQSF